MSSDAARSGRLLGFVPQSVVTPLTAAVFLVIGVSGLMIFFGIQEGLVKELHEWLGVGFVVVAVLHLAKNWRPFTLMLRRPAMLGSSAAVAAITAVFITGAVMGGAGGGNPMRGVIHAVEAAPLDAAAGVFQLETGEMLTRLRKAGIEPGEDARSLGDIAERNGVETPHVMAAILQPRAE